MTNLGWKPRVQLPELIKMMIAHDLKLAEQDKYLNDGGYMTKHYYE